MPTVITPAGSQGAFTGTTAVTIVAAPGASQQHVVTFVKFYNRDTVSHDFTLRFDANGTNYDHKVTSVAAGEWVEFGEEDRIVLDATTDILKAFTDATATTTEPFWQVTYGVRVVS